MKRAGAFLLAGVLAASVAVATPSGHPAGRAKGRKGHPVALANGRVVPQPGSEQKHDVELRVARRHIDETQRRLAKAEARLASETNPRRKRAAQHLVNHLQLELRRLNDQLVKLANLKPGQ